MFKPNPPLVVAEPRGRVASLRAVVSNTWAPATFAGLCPSATNISEQPGEAADAIMGRRNRLSNKVKPALRLILAIIKNLLLIEKQCCLAWAPRNGFISAADV
jgi:hypothetical protein